MWALRVAAFMVGKLQALRCIGDYIVHKALNAVLRSTSTLSLRHPHLQDCVLVHVGAVFKVVHEVQRLPIRLVDLTCHKVVLLAWQVQRPQGTLCSPLITSGKNSTVRPMPQKAIKPCEWPSMTLWLGWPHFRLPSMKRWVHMSRNWCRDLKVRRIPERKLIGSLSLPGKSQATGMICSAYLNSVLDLK